MTLMLQNPQVVAQDSHTLTFQVSVKKKGDQLLIISSLLYTTDVTCCTWSNCFLLNAILNRTWILCTKKLLGKTKTKQDVKISDTM
jgi:hypothetical protein